MVKDIYVKKLSYLSNINIGRDKFTNIRNILFLLTNYLFTKHV